MKSSWYPGDAGAFSVCDRILGGSSGGRLAGEATPKYHLQEIMTPQLNMYVGIWTNEPTYQYFRSYPGKIDYCQKSGCKDKPPIEGNRINNALYPADHCYYLHLFSELQVPFRNSIKYCQFLSAANIPRFVVLQDTLTGTDLSAGRVVV